MLRKHCLLCGLVGFINDEGTFQSHKQRLNEMQMVSDSTMENELTHLRIEGERNTSCKNPMDVEKYPIQFILSERISVLDRTRIGGLN